MRRPEALLRQMAEALPFWFNSELTKRRHEDYVALKTAVTGLEEVLPLLRVALAQPGVATELPEQVEILYRAEEKLAKYKREKGCHECGKYHRPERHQ